MYNVLVDVSYEILNKSPKKVIARVTVGLPCQPDTGDLIDLFFDNETMFMGQMLNICWGWYDCHKQRRTKSADYDCQIVQAQTDKIVIDSPVFHELMRELAVLEGVIKYNIALKGALPSNKALTLAVDERGVIDIPFHF